MIRIRSRVTDDSTVNTVPVASPGFVARRGKAGNYAMGHSRRTSGPGAAAARWLTVLWLMQYLSKELWVVDICTSWSRRLHYLDSWLSDLLQSELKMKLLEVEWSHAPVPHSWRRHCTVLSNYSTDTGIRDTLHCFQSPAIALPFCFCVYITRIDPELLDWFEQICRYVCCGKRNILLS